MNWFHRPPLSAYWWLLPVGVWLALSALGWL